MTNSDLFKLYDQVSQTLSFIRDEIQNRNIDWRHLVENGLIIEAIKALRKKNPDLSLKEAKEYVDAFRAM